MYSGFIPVGSSFVIQYKRWLETREAALGGFFLRVASFELEVIEVTGEAAGEADVMKLK